MAATNLNTNLKAGLTTTLGFMALTLWAVPGVILSAHAEDAPPSADSPAPDSPVADYAAPESPTASNPTQQAGVAGETTEISASHSSDLQNVSDAHDEVSEDDLGDQAGRGYNITDHVRITPTAYWQWLPSAGGNYSVQDPFVKLSDDAIISEGNFNLYGDIRYHAPISNFSKAANITGSYQSVQVATYIPEGTRWMLNLFSSERAYTYGPQGYGNDFEVYIAPNIGYQITPKVQLTMLYETNLVHVYGNNPGTLEGDGTDLQPGVSIDLTNNINFHPYLSIYPSAPSIASTSVGALLYWQAF
jgi:hypothetical protein